MSDDNSYTPDEQPEGSQETEGETAIEQPPAETPEVEDSGEEAEGEGDAGAPDPVAELRAELDKHRAELEQLRPFADLGQRVARGQVQQNQQRVNGDQARSEELVREGMRILFSSSAGDENARSQAFQALPPDVRSEVTRRAKDVEESDLLRVTDPEKWAEKHIAPVVRRLVAPIYEQVALREFERTYPDLQDPASRDALAPLLQRGVDLETAAKVVRSLRPKAPATPADADTETARAVRDARRGRAARKPAGAPTTKPPKVSGVYLEDVMRELEARGEEL